MTDLRVAFDMIHPCQGLGRKPRTRHEEEDGDQGYDDVHLLDGHQLLPQEAQVVHDQVQEDCLHPPIDMLNQNMVTLFE